MHDEIIDHAASKSAGFVDSCFGVLTLGVFALGEGGRSTLTGAAVTTAS